MIVYNIDKTGSRGGKWVSLNTYYRLNYFSLKINYQLIKEVSKGLIKFQHIIILKCIKRAFEITLSIAYRFISMCSIIVCQTQVLMVKRW